MPELPEVETIVRSLAPSLIGRRLDGRLVTAVRRYGKYILIDTAAGDTLTVHLGMTGRLLLDAPRGPHTRTVFDLDEGAGTLLYDDIRKFGRAVWNSSPPVLGPDPLSITEAEFLDLLRHHRSRIKSLLLDQSFLRGLGNIYTDEALFRAAIHPRARNLSAPRARRLHQAIVEVLQLAIEHRGSSISDYVDSEGRKGTFQLLHRVYGKEGQPCLNCATPIRRTVVAQRGTHYCPKCQRR